MTLQNAEKSERVFVSDFDGTMTQHDFYKLAIESLMPPDTPDYWAEYRTGSITHFEALACYFAAIRARKEDILAVLKRMNLDSKIPAAVTSLRQAGWKVVVASAGCEWYIRQLLDDAGVLLEIHANPGQLKTGKGLLMHPPKKSPYFSPTLGVDKTRIVQQFISEGATVAFAGDGFPDVDPARLVPEHLRFARGDLAKVLQSEGLTFQPFETWSDIAPVLLRRSPADA